MSITRVLLGAVVLTLVLTLLTGSTASATTPDPIVRDWEFATAKKASVVTYIRNDSSYGVATQTIGPFLVFYDGNENVTALNPTSGALVWTQRVTSPTRPVIQNGIVLVVSNHTHTHTHTHSSTATTRRSRLPQQPRQHQQRPRLATQRLVAAATA